MATQQTIASNTEAAILSRLIHPERDDLSDETAKALLHIKNFGSSGSCVPIPADRFWGRDQRPQFPPQTPTSFPLLCSSGRLFEAKMSFGLTTTRQVGHCLHQ
jgi:hypothetical protein